MSNLCNTIEKIKNDFKQLEGGNLIEIEVESTNLMSYQDSFKIYLDSKIFICLYKDPHEDPFKRGYNPYRFFIRTSNNSWAIKNKDCVLSHINAFSYLYVNFENIIKIIKSEV